MISDCNDQNYQEFAGYFSRLKRVELADYLENLREPVWECELMRIACPEADLVSGPPIEMYRWHFILFHALYSMSAELAARGLYLHVHFMRTCVKPYPEPSCCRYFDDDLTSFCNAPGIEGAQFCEFHFSRIDEMAIDSLSERYFYLDWKNFSALSAANVEKFMNGAWQLLKNHDDYLHCLSVMGLPEGISLAVLRTRFRHLAKTMHPDISKGNHDEFARINDAYRKLLNYLGNG